MKNQKILMRTGLILSVAALSSCASTDVELADNLDSDLAINFSTYTQGVSRAAVVDNAALKKSGFGVIAYSTVDKSLSDFLTAESTPNFMNQQKVSYGSAWTYSPLKYWSIDETAKYSFLAYGPYDKVSSKDITTTGVTPAIAYSLVKDGKFSDGYDLVATQNLDLSRNSNGGNTQVSFNFAHATSRVAIHLISKEQTYTDAENGTLIVVKNISFNGDNVYTSGSLSLLDNTWSGLKTAGTTDYSLSALNTADLSDLVDGYKTKGVALGTSTDAVNALGDNNYLFLIPTNGETADDQFNVKIDIDVVTIDSSLKDGYSVESFTRELPLDVDLEQGYAYNFNFNLSLDAITFDASVIDWNEEDEVKDNTEVTVYADYVLKKGYGDFTYDGGSEKFTVNNDGTCSIDVTTGSAVSAVYIEDAEGNHWVAASKTEYTLSLDNSVNICKSENGHWQSVTLPSSTSMTLTYDPTKGTLTATAKKE